MGFPKFMQTDELIESKAQRKERYLKKKRGRR